MFRISRFAAQAQSQRRLVLAKGSSIRLFSAVKDSKREWQQRIRNIGIFAHIDAGKTTTTERMLYYAGIVRKPGNVDDGDTVTDFLQEERDRGITIQSAAISFPWKTSIINLIDTPGHVDFSVEVERCLRVLDGGIAVLDGVAGVEAQTETVWEQANRYKLPRLLYVNKLDRVGADFEHSLKMVEERLGSQCLRLQLPYIENDDFIGVADVVRKTFIRFAGDEAGSFKEEPLPAVMQEATDKAHAELLERLADADETFGDWFLEGKTEEMEAPRNVLQAIRRVLIRNAHAKDFSLTPVFCGSSLKNKGIQQLLDGVDALLPSPLEVGLPDIYHYVNKQLVATPYLECLHPDKKVAGSAALAKFLKKDPLILYAFKLQHSSQGMIVFARVYKGTVKSKATLFNTRTRRPEKVLRIMQVSADHTESLDEAYEGQIIALLGLNAVRTGDTLTSAAADFTLEPIRVLAPVFTVNVEAENQAELSKLEKVLKVMTLEDPSLVYENDEESGQLLLSGMGELHLEILQQRLKREFGLEAYYSKMRVNYRESVGEAIELDGQVDRRINNRDYSVKVGMEVEPCDAEANEVLTEKNKFNRDGVRMNDEVEAALREGLNSCLSRGPILGYTMTHTRIRLDPEACQWDLQTPPVVLQAAVIACWNAEIRKHKTLLLEPMMKYEATISSKAMGNVVTDLTSKRRGEVKEVTTTEMGSSKRSQIHAIVPLAEMIGYSSVIRVLTGGENSYSLTFDSYAEVPDDVVERVKRG
ncbi:hypothetical protein WA556_004831, partial [Blastocystis sp. ATCC 50177/Nand II]